MPKSKSKRGKRYRPRTKPLGYIQALDPCGNELVSEEHLQDVERGFLIHLDAFVKEPNLDSWAMMAGVFLMADRLSYDPNLKGAEELRKYTTAAFRQLDDAWRIWTEKKVIAEQNLRLAREILPSVLDFLSNFTYNELSQAKEYVMNHDLKPVEVLKREGRAT